MEKSEVSAMDEKTKQRLTALTRRGELTLERRAQASAAICRKLTELFELQRAKTIMTYAAISDEVDLSPLHDWLWQQGKRIAFPVTEGQGIMHAVEAKKNTPWRKGRYGIWEPMGQVHDPTSIDVVLVPCVAFDAKCHRLGHGGGYYDRYLPACPQAKYIAVAFEAQRMEEVNTDCHDQTMDLVVTEQAIYHKEEQHGSN